MHTYSVLSHKFQAAEGWHSYVELIVIKIRILLSSVTWDKNNWAVAALNTHLGTILYKNYSRVHKNIRISYADLGRRICHMYHFKYVYSIKHNIFKNNEILHDYVRITLYVYLKYYSYRQSDFLELAQDFGTRVTISHPHVNILLAKCKLVSWM